MKAVSILAFGMLVLAGCASNPAPNTITKSGSIQNSMVSTQQFTCDIGLDVAVKHLGNGQIELSTSDGKRGVLTQAVSGSGERYTTNTGLWGHGGEWHQKGSEAYFEYVGVHGGKAKSTSCTTK